MLSNGRLTFLPICLVIVTVSSQVDAQQSSDEGDLYSLILVQRDLFDAQKTMTICDTNDDGFIDAAERKKLPWRDKYAEFDLNKDKKLTHLEVAVWQAKQREAFNITQFDINNAKANIRRKDKNSNGQLDPDEIAQGWPPDPQEYDKNSDGIITQFEYARQLAFKRGLKRELGIEAVDNMSAVKTLTRFDKNRDNLLDKKELSAVELPRKPMLHDDDDDGKLSHIELAILFSKHRRDTGLSKSDAVKAKRLMEMADVNRDGKLTDKELTMGVFSVDEQGGVDYKQYDKDVDGTITLAEIQVFIAADRKRMGYDDTHLAEAKRLMLRHDQNRTNYIEAYEFPDNALVGKLKKEALEQADLDKDDRISLEELAKHLAKASS
jgi:Ca2+-binding EF-hand superfamily protein